MTEETWKCHICGEERPDSAIDVYTRDISHVYDLPAKSISENIRFCRDRAACVKGVAFYSHLKNAPCNLRDAAQALLYDIVAMLAENPDGDEDAPPWFGPFEENEQASLDGDVLINWPNLYITAERLRITLGNEDAAADG